MDHKNCQEPRKSVLDITVFIILLCCCFSLYFFLLLLLLTALFTVQIFDSLVTVDPRAPEYLLRWTSWSYSFSSERDKKKKSKQSGIWRWPINNVCFEKVLPAKQFSQSQKMGLNNFYSGIFKKKKNDSQKINNIPLFILIGI